MQTCGCMAISQKMMPRNSVWDARRINSPSFMTSHFMVLHTKFTMEACMCFTVLILCSHTCSNAKLIVLRYTKRFCHKTEQVYCTLSHRWERAWRSCAFPLSNIRSTNWIAVIIVECLAGLQKTIEWLWYLMSKCLVICDCNVRKCL